MTTDKNNGQDDDANPLKEKTSKRLADVGRVKARSKSGPKKQQRIKHRRRQSADYKFANNIT